MTLMRFVTAAALLAFPMVASAGYGSDDDGHQSVSARCATANPCGDEVSVDEDSVSHDPCEAPAPVDPCDAGSDDDDSSSYDGARHGAAVQTTQVRTNDGMDLSARTRPGERLDQDDDIDLTPGVDITPGFDPTPDIDITPGWEPGQASARVRPNEPIEPDDDVDLTPGVDITPGFDPTPDLDLTPGYEPGQSAAVHHPSAPVQSMGASYPVMGATTTAARPVSGTVVSGTACALPAATCGDPCDDDDSASVDHDACGEVEEKPACLDECGNAMPAAPAVETAVWPARRVDSCAGACAAPCVQTCTPSVCSAQYADDLRAMYDANLTELRFTSMALAHAECDDLADDLRAAQRDRIDANEHLISLAQDNCVDLGSGPDEAALQARLAPFRAATCGASSDDAIRAEMHRLHHDRVARAQALHDRLDVIDDNPDIDDVDDFAADEARSYDVWTVGEDEDWVFYG